MSLKQQKNNLGHNIKKNFALPLIKPFKIFTQKADKQVLYSTLLVVLLLIVLCYSAYLILQFVLFLSHQVTIPGVESKDAITVAALAFSIITSPVIVAIVAWISPSQNSHSAKKNKAEEIYEIYKELWEFLSEIALCSKQAKSHEEALKLYHKFTSRIMASGSSTLQNKWLELKPLFIKICLDKTELNYPENQDIILDCLYTMNKQINGSTASRIKNDTFNKFIQ